jgi:hypothetical protein
VLPTFFLLVIVFLQEVEKDVKDKAGVKIRFLTRNDSLAANQGFYIYKHEQGGGLNMAMKNPFNSGETTIFKPKFEIILTLVREKKSP